MSPRISRADGGRRLDHWFRPHLAPDGRHSSSLVGQFVLLAGGLTAYFAVRGITKGAVETAHTNAEDILAFERSLGIAWEAAAQRAVLEHPTWVSVWNSIYVYWYWPPLIAALVWLWRSDRRGYAVLRDALVFSGAIGLVIFALYPVAPPRFLDGFTDTIAQSRRGMFISQPPGFVNKYAAVPSFHVGWLALAGVVVASRAPATWQWLAYLPAIAMSGAVVFTGNHYIIDGVVGVTVCMVGLAIAQRVHEPAVVVHRLPARHAGLGMAMASRRDHL